MTRRTFTSAIFLVRMRMIRSDSQFVLVTNAKNHASFAGWERVFVGQPPDDMEYPVNVEKSPGRSQRGLHFTGNHADTDAVLRGRLRAAYASG